MYLRIMDKEDFQKHKYPFNCKKKCIHSRNFQTVKIKIMEYILYKTNNSFVLENKVYMEIHSNIIDKIE